jgi:hypothetical protein
MDRVTDYQTIIKNILHHLAEIYGISQENEIEKALIIDDEHGHYLLFDIGWKGHERIERPWVYVRLKNKKFWIEDDWTEDGIVAYLKEAGVPNEDIVLAFNPPDMREYTEFAVA